jgi:tripartite-type tricarboxylate transporter receptor subunit TctC
MHRETSMPILTRRFVAGLALALSLAAPAVTAQTWPAKPVRLLVGFPPGGGVDLLARLLADKLAPGLGQPVVVDNRPGQAAAVATELGAKAAPDGYTLLMANIGTMALNPAIYPAYPVHPTRDFAPISRLVTYSLVIFVPADGGAANLNELVAMARARPGQLNYGSAGNGGITHIAGELFKRAAGIDMVHVPYKGSAPAMTDLAAGRLQMQIDITGVAAPFAGRVRPLASTGAQRSALSPDLPTAQELGIPFALSGWQAIVAPAGTPPAIVERLNREVRKVLADPDVIRRLNAQGNDPAPSSPEELAALIARDGERMGKVIRDAGIKAD